MDEKADGGGASKLGSSSVSPQVKGSKNKRKLADSAPGSPINFTSSLTEFPRYESSSGNSQIPLSDLLSLEVESDQEPVVEEFQPGEWDDPIVCQLEELLSANLTTLFRNAINRIVECGYSEDIAEKAVSRRALYFRGKDLVSNIVNDTLAFLKKVKDIDFSRYQMFKDFQHMVEYTMLEMISVIQEIKPALSVGEAVWWLLMCDLNISQACEVEGDTLSSFSFKEVSGESSSDSALPQSKSKAQTSESFHPNPNEPNNQRETLKFGSIPYLPNSRNPLAREGLPPNLPYPRNPLAYEGLPPNLPYPRIPLAHEGLPPNLPYPRNPLAHEGPPPIPNLAYPKNPLACPGLPQNLPNPGNPLAHEGLPPNLPNPRNPLAHEGPPQKEYTVSMTDSVEKFLGATGECVRTVSQTSASEEKSGTGRKGRSIKELAGIRQKNLHFEKNHRGYGKGAFKSGKLANIGGFVVEKRQKSPSELPSVHMKTTSSKISIEVGPLAPLADGSHDVSSTTSPALPATNNVSSKPMKGTVRALPAANTETDNASTKPMKGTVLALPAANTKLAVSSSSEKKPAPKSEASISGPPNTPDFYAGIPYDDLLGKHVPQDEKDELILKLVPRMQDLQNELHSWTEWTNQKVMQAARRLGKDQPELKLLRQEKAEAEQYKKDKQILEENTMKRLSEMEFALNNATNQVERASSSVRKLEVEHSLIKKEMDAAKLQAAKSAASCQEALEREQKALKNAQLWEGQKSLLQEEIETNKQKVAELQQGVSKAKNLHNQIEARWKKERMAKEKLLAQAASIRKEREQLEAAAKAEEDMILQKAENDRQKYKEDIKILESKLSELKLKAESSKIAALRRGTDGSYGSFLTDSKGANMCMNQNPTIFRRVANFPDNFGTGGLRQDRECVMCLSEEKTVVFLPCAHQVLCANCNELHEKQGMKDCPSCRTPIQWRVRARYANP